MPNALRRLFKLKTKSISLINGLTGFTGFDNSTDINNLNSYKDSLYLYIGVSMIAKRAAGIPLELYKIKNKRGDVTEVFDHPLLSLLSKPNALQTQREFMEISIAYYLLSGDSFWYLERNGTSIQAIYPLRPDRVRLLMSPDQTTIIAYEYTTTTIAKFAPEDILHVKNCAG